MKPVLSRLMPAALALCLLFSAAACGGDDDAESDLGVDAPTGSNGDTSEDPSADTDNEDEGSGDESDEAAAVCDLLTDDEVAAAVGFPVVDKEANTMALPTCDWELDASSAKAASFPVLSMVLLPEDEYQVRADQMRELMTPVDGVGDEALMSFADIPNTTAMVQFLAIDGDQGVNFLPGVHQWEDRASAEAALGELASLVFERA